MYKKVGASGFKMAVTGMLLGIALTAALSFKGWQSKPNCAISLDKMNVIYIGVENPVSIVVRGVPEDSVVITTQNVNLKKYRDDLYIASATTPGEATITVSGGDMGTKTFRYRVKRIPDPRPKLGGIHSSRTMRNGEFKAQGGISTVLDNFDFDIYCEVTSYNMTYMARHSDPITVENTGGRFNSHTADLIYKAKPGDRYFFDNIKLKCPGDAGARVLEPLIFTIQ
jgi:hypothetical protein